MAWNLFVRKEIPTVETPKNTTRQLTRELCIFMVFILVLSVSAGVYPYIATVNPRGIDAGQDISNYVEWANIVEGEFTQIFNVSGGSRPLIFLAIMGFQKITGLETLAAIRFLPVFLNPLMVLTFFFLIQEATQDVWLAAVAAFFTATGYPVTVNMSSYFLTNVLALCFAFLSLGFLVRRMRLGERKNLIISLLFGALLIFTHPWTFVQFYVVFLVISVLLLFFSKSREGTQGIIFDVFIYTISLGVVDFLKTFIFRGVGGVAASTRVIIGLTTLSTFWTDIVVSLKIMFGGLYSNLLLLGLALLGLLIARSRGFLDHYYELFLGLSSLVFVMGDTVIKSRVLYNFPIVFLIFSSSSPISVKTCPQSQ